MERAIVLQANGLTKTEENTLRKFSADTLELANDLLGHRKSKCLMDLHKETYSTSKATTSFNSQAICDIENVVKCKGSKLGSDTVKFNVPRNCKTFSTRANHFVELGMYPRKRTAIPIRQNKNYQRYRSLLDEGWSCKTYGLAGDGQTAAYLSKEGGTFPERPNMLGIDINAKCFAVSIVTPQ